MKGDVKKNEFHSYLIAPVPLSSSWRSFWRVCLLKFEIEIFEFRIYHTVGLFRG